MPERARARAFVLAAALALPALAAAALAPPGGAADANGDGLVVVAVVDSGVNPYHADFRDATRTASPASYVPGYPTDATRLDLAMGATTLAAARDADAATFAHLAQGKLYWIPGTKIIGAFVAAKTGATPLWDDDGHGTATASLAAGRVHGYCPRCLLVIVEGFAGIAWATEQPWIDVVTNSWGPDGNVGAPVKGWGFENDWTMRAAERGQTVLFAAGNGVENAYVTPESTWTSNTNGPDWVVNVGAYSTTNGAMRPIAGTGRPVDVLGPGLDVPAAAVDSLDGEASFSGTSAATPVAAGAIADTLLRVRAAIGDPGVGERRAADAWRVALGRPMGAGALADGRLIRAELWDAVFASATPTAASSVALYPMTAPSSDVAMESAMAEGYGAITRETSAKAAQVLLGARPMPDRSDVSDWFALDAWMRDTIWGYWDRNGDGIRDREVTPTLVLA